MNVRLPFVFLAGLIAISLASCRQTPSIRGQVIDQFGVPLSGVSIQVMGTSFTASTDDEGHYQVTFAPGNFAVIYRRDGYTSFSREYSITAPTALPAESVLLYLLPEGDSVLAYSAGKALPLEPGNIKSIRVDVPIPDDVRTSLKIMLRKTLDRYFPAGPLIDLESGDVAFMDRVSTQKQLLKLLDGGFLMERTVGMTESTDKVEIVAEQIQKVEENAILRRPAAPLAPGIYALVSVSGKWSDVNGPGTNTAFLAPFLGSPIGGPCFLFRVGSQSPLQGVFDPLEQQRLESWDKVSSALNQKLWSEGMRLAETHAQLWPKDDPILKELPGLFEQALRDLVQREDWNAVKDLAAPGTQIESTRPLAETASKAAEADSLEAKYRNGGGSYGDSQAAAAWLARGDLFSTCGLPPAALNAWETGAELSQKSQASDRKSGVAWIMATNSDPAYRDGARAVRLATSACEDTRAPDGGLLDTLAAALAESGRFDEAVETQARALTELTNLRSANRSLLPILLDLITRFALYRQRTPYHEDAPKVLAMRKAVEESGREGIPDALKGLAGVWRNSQALWEFQANGTLRMISNRSSLIRNGSWKLTNAKDLQLQFPPDRGISGFTWNGTVDFFNGEHLILSDPKEDLFTRVTVLMPSVSNQALLGRWRLARRLAVLGWRDETTGNFVLRPDQSGQIQDVDFTNQDQPMRWSLIGDVLLIDPGPGSFDLYRIREYQKTRILLEDSNSQRLIFVR